MKSPRSVPICLCLAFLLWLAPLAHAVEIPPEGKCPPQDLRRGPDGAPVDADAVPPSLEPGQKIAFDDLQRIDDFLPPEVWERRQTFFFEGQNLVIGPCYRRYPAAPYFEKATAANYEKVRIDESGGLVGFDGHGLPFPPASIADDAPDAGARWAWNYRYRYQGAGFRGRFRLMEVMRRGDKVERFEGRFFMMPLHGVPGGTNDEENRFVAGGEFTQPRIARGLAWRQFRREDADRDFGQSDEVFVYIPSARKTRRAPPQNVEGVYIPSYTRGNTIDSSRVTLPGGETVGDVTLTAAEPVRKAFTAQVIRPNAYAFELAGVTDVLAPINTTNVGYPANGARSYGPSGLSVANDTWELRRALVLRGDRKEPIGNVRHLTLYVDAQTLAPLYMISRRGNRSVYEVGIFVGLYSGDDPLAAKWEGNQEGHGLILPAAQTVKVTGEGGWLRESFEWKSDPPDEDTAKKHRTTRRLQIEGR